MRLMLSSWQVATVMREETAARSATVLTVFRASGTGLTAHAPALRKQVGWVKWLSGGVPAADIETAERVIDALGRRLAEAGTSDEGC